jgi:anti-sigma regulatory factor (Ser/Thr protein kinase)
VKSHIDSYRHDAFFYAGMDEFVATCADFIRDGLVNDEAVLVVVSAEKIRRLQAALGEGAGQVQFIEMAKAGKNPARIIPLWRDWVDSHEGTGRALRGIGEPITPERRFDELLECTRHESLLNLAFRESEPFWLLCPYDVTALAEDVVDAARTTHPSWMTGDAWQPSDDYRPVDMAAPFADPLTPLPGHVDSLMIVDDDMKPLRELVSRHARAVGFSTDREWDLVLAVNELATNSIRHGGGRGTLRVCADEAAGVVMCEVTDHGLLTDPLAGRVHPDFDRANGRGLWIANQLCDLVQLHSGPDGTTIRLTMRRA